MKSWFIIISLLVFSCIIVAQENSDEEFIIGNKIYKPNTNWFKIAQGVSYHFSMGQLEYNTLLSYSFRIKKYWFQTGYHVSSNRFFIRPSMQRLNDIFIMYGKRKETQKFNLAAFAGLSFAYGGTFHHSEWTDGRITEWYVGFNQPGLITTLDVTFKPTYDLGVGFSAFTSLNKRYNVVGLQVHFFFSGAYKGKIE